MNLLITIQQKITVYALICLYAFALIRPIMPIVNDTVAHIFFKMEHMATVHFENGKYHVHIELQKADETSNAKSSPSTAAFFDTLDSHLKTASITFVVTNPTTLPKPLFPIINFPVNVCLKSPTPPPEV